jgi:hypothetical protein
VVPGAVLVLVPVVVAATTWSALVANHPLYPLLLLTALLVGLWLIVSGVRAATPPKPGAIRTTLRWAAAAGAIGLAATLFWLKPFVAAAAALDALNAGGPVTLTDTRSETTYAPAAPPTAGLVMYPGARVDPRAYAVLATAVAEQGYLVVVPKCPLDLELLCINAADEYVTGDIPWAVGGHSLGGVAASTYADAQDAVEGLVFWAAYPIADLSDRDDLTVASISGSEDGFSTPQDIADTRDLLPAATAYTEIEGAIHAFFGDYGDQPGDGNPTISREDAQAQIVEATVALLGSLGTAA